MTKMDHPDNLATGETRHRRRLVRRLRPLLFALGPVLVILVGGYLWLTGGRYVSTDDSYVKFDMVTVSPAISGRVTEVAVKENQRVKAGDTLFVIDPDPFRIAVAQAEARLAAAHQQVDGLRADYRQKQAELAIAKESVDYLTREFQRQEALRAGNVVSQARFDEVRHSLDVARQQVSAVGQGLAKTLASLSGNPNLPDDQDPGVRQAEAALAQAKFNLSNTVIKASVAGVIANFDLQVGEYVPAGTPVFALVAVDSPWIEANLKETDLAHLKVGDSADVTVDAYPGRHWQATVESISPGTGAEFSVLPPQNASGNWVKVVQRVPVRVAIRAESGAPALRAGMTAGVEIDTGYQPSVYDLVGTAVASAWK